MGGLSLLLCSHCQVREKGLDLGRAHFTRMPLVMEDDKAFDPIGVGMFRAFGVMQQAHFSGDLVEQFGRPRFA